MDGDIYDRKGVLVPVSNNQPWDFDEARDRCRRAAIAQEGVETEVRSVSRGLAVAEEEYRVALAKEILRLRAEGVAATVCADLARGEPHVAKLRYHRDVAEGIYEAVKHAAWRHTANRKDAQRFSDWSQRREMAEGGQPEWQTST